MSSLDLIDYALISATMELAQIKKVHNNHPSFRNEKITIKLNSTIDTIRHYLQEFKQDNDLRLALHQKLKMWIRAEKIDAEVMQHFIQLLITEKMVADYKVDDKYLQHELATRKYVNAFKLAHNGSHGYVDGVTDIGLLLRKQRTEAYELIKSDYGNHQLNSHPLVDATIRLIEAPGTSGKSLVGISKDQFKFTKRIPDKTLDAILHKLSQNVGHLENDAVKEEFCKMMLACLLNNFYCTHTQKLFTTVPLQANDNLIMEQLVSALKSNDLVDVNNILTESGIHTNEGSKTDNHIMPFLRKHKTQLMQVFEKIDLLKPPIELENTPRRHSILRTQL